MAAHQLLAGWIIGAAVRLLYGVRYTDMCPFRAIRRDALMRLGMREETYGWNLEMQMRAARAGLRILELPVAHRRRAGGVSKVSGNLRGTIKASWRILAAFARIAAEGRRRSRGSRPVGREAHCDEPEPVIRCHRVGHRSGVDHGGVLAAGARQRDDRGYVWHRLPEQRTLLAPRAVVVPLHHRRVLVAAKPVEIAAALHRPSRGAVRQDRACLLDGSDGQARGDPAAGRFRQQYRAAAFLPVRADRLCRSKC